MLEATSVSGTTILLASTMLFALRVFLPYFVIYSIKYASTPIAKTP
jgi:hypothetical protein